MAGASGSSSSELMKTCALLILTLLLAAPSRAGTNRSDVTLTGIVAVGDWKRAACEVRPGDRLGRSEWPILGEEDRWEGVDVIRIDPGKAAVEVRENGAVRTLTIPGPQERGGSAGPDARHPASLWIQQAPLRQVLEIYGELTKRTILQHPQSGATRLSFEVQAAGPAQAVTAFRERLEKAGLALIPDGTKFLQVLPAALTNTARPQSDRLATPARAIPVPPPAGTTIPNGVVRLTDTDVSQVLDLYGEVVGRTARNQDPVSGPRLNLHSNTPLSYPELLYALDTLLAWNGLRIILHDDGLTFTAERFSSATPDNGK
jgi:hypothetical protein